jgi:hypothetical protein
MGCGQGNSPPTPTQDGLPQSGVGHVEDIGPVWKHVDVTKHCRAPILLAYLTEFPKGKNPSNSMDEPSVNVQNTQDSR